MEDQTKDLALVKQDMVSLSASRPDFMDGDVVIKLFEKRSNLMKRIRAVALKTTTPADWVDFGGKPYLQASGAEKVRQELGLNIKIIRSIHTPMEDEKGKYDIFSHVLEVSHPALGSVEVIGKKSTRDKFYAIKTEWHEKDGKKEKVIIEKEQWSIPKTDVDKAAYSNAMQRAITEFCGLRNLTWEQIREIVGAQIEQQAAGVTFQNQKNSTTTGDGQTDAGKSITNSPEKIAAARTEIMENVLKLCDNDAERAKALLIKIFRHADLNKLSEKQTFWFVGQLRKGLVKEGE